MENKKLTVGGILGYGLGSVGENIGYTIFYNFFLFFLTDMVGISAAIAGTISLLAVLWDGVTDPALGYISDNSKNPRGRRGPIIMKASFALGATIFIMFTDLQFLDASVKGFYFLIANMLFWLSLTCCDIPYLALAAELETSPGGRTKLRSVAAAFLQGGMLIASAGMLPLVNFFSKSGNELRGWSLAALVLGIIACASYFICGLSARKFEPPNPNLQEGMKEKSEKVSVGGFIKSTLLLFKFRPYVILLALTFFIWFSINMQSSALMYFCTNNVGMSDAQITAQYTVVGIACAITPLILAPITNKYGKKATASTILGVTGIIMAIMSVFTSWNMAQFYVFRILSIIIMTVWYVTIYAMVYDVSDYDELENGVRRDGGMQSMFQFSIKMATALSMWLVGVLLESFGYVGTAATQTEEALVGIKNVTVLFPAIMQLVGVVIILIYPITNKKMHSIVAALKERQ